MKAFHDYCRQQLDSIRAQGRYRTFTPMFKQADEFPVYRRADGSRVIVWSSNDYLAMGGHPALIEAGPGRSIRILGPEEDLARQILKLCTPEQAKLAHLDTKAPDDLRVGPNAQQPTSQPETTPAVGLPLSKMSNDQKKLLGDDQPGLAITLDNLAHPLVRLRNALPFALLHRLGRGGQGAGRLGLHHGELHVAETHAAPLLGHVRTPQSASLCFFAHLDDRVDQALAVVFDDAFFERTDDRVDEVAGLGSDRLEFGREGEVDGHPGSWSS